MAAELRQFSKNKHYSHFKKSACRAPNIFGSFVMFPLSDMYTHLQLFCSQKDTKESIGKSLHKPNKMEEWLTYENAAEAQSF